jgi:HPt (histidine-containing phosphotransfer) domain-containing protein
MDVSLNTYSIPTELSVINWDDAMEQVGGDIEFLHEVLEDIKNEIREATSSIQENLAIYDYTQVERSAHRIKGSCAYLFCEKLRHVSHDMQMLNITEHCIEVKRLKYYEMFETFKECANELVETIDTKFEKSQPS